MAGYEIIDTPVNVTRYLPRLANTHSIIRYITRGNPSGAKHVKVPEVKAIKAAGKKLAIVHETYGDIAHAGRGGISKADGERDGAYSRRIMPALGAPAGACVYFAVDTDVPAAQIRSHVIPYFKAIKDAFSDGEYRVGVYGPGAVCQALKTAGLCDLFWLANAKGWSGYARFKSQADLVQRLPTKIVGGLDVDPNDAQVEDWGQFEPFADDAAILPLVDAEAGDLDDPVTVDGNPKRLGAGEPSVSVGDVIGAGTMGAVGAFGSLKSLIKSKIAWLTGALGGTGATATVAADPEAQSLLMRLVEKPSFWLTLLCIALAGLVIYYRYKDHGRGQE